LKQIVKAKALDKIVELLLATGSKYNLVNSAIIELVEFIRKVNLNELRTKKKDKI